ncbi:MAG: hypothetical protein V7K83_00375 [Nostoc sp.]
MVLSKALTLHHTRIGIQKTLAMPQFSVTGATGVIQFQGSDRHNGKMTIVTLHPNCHSKGFMLTVSERVLVCY